MKACIVGGKYLDEGFLGQAASSPEVEDTTTHLRKDLIIYLSDGCVEREGRGRSCVFVWLLVQVQTQRSWSSLHSDPPLNSSFLFYFLSWCGQKGALSLGLNTT